MKVNINALISRHIEAVQAKMKGVELDCEAIDLIERFALDGKSVKDTVKAVKAMA